MRERWLWRIGVREGLTWGVPCGIAVALAGGPERGIGSLVISMLVFGVSSAVFAAARAKNEQEADAAVIGPVAPEVWNSLQGALVTGDLLEDPSYDLALGHLEAEHRRRLLRDRRWCLGAGAVLVVVAVVDVAQRGAAGGPAGILLVVLVGNRWRRLSTTAGRLDRLVSALLSRPRVDHGR